MEGNAKPLAPAASPENRKLQPNQVGVIGATSLVGTCLLPLLSQASWQVTAFTRQAVGGHGDAVKWQQLPIAELPSSSSIAPLPTREKHLPLWICVAPIWALPEHFGLLETHNARRVVVLSSTSLFTKENSPGQAEQALAHRLTAAEAQVQAWAKNHGIEWLILRPTLIYGLGLDKNIAEITRFIRRFGFFPIFGKANGLRQPIHATDVAKACVAALMKIEITNRSYNISGGEIITYREMVSRIFSTMDRKCRLLPVPLWVFRLTVLLLRPLPRYRQWTSTMAERMNHDLVFDHSDATRDFNFSPRGFLLSNEDIPF